MRRVAITGIGIVSCIGNSTAEVSESLKNGKSGISRADKYVELGFRSQIYGMPALDIEARVDKRVRRFMGEGAAWNYVAMEQAIADAGLEENDIINPMTGLIMGSGGPSTRTLVEAADTTRDSGPKRIGPFAVPKCMSSTNSATLATPFGIKGINYSISSACATSTHCIGNAAEMIQWGKQDVMFAGGGEALEWSLSSLFDAMGAMSSKYNDTPATASRAYDKNRDGFVIAGGAGVLVLEEMERAQKRGAKIYAEVSGYGATSDGHDMVQPSGEGAIRCMEMAMKDLDVPVDYINPHATSTPVGDIKEIEALRKVFGADCPPISATKSLTGHSLGAAGVQEAIYSLLMMQNDFIAASAHIEELDPEYANRSASPGKRRSELRAVKFLWLWRHQWLAGDETGLTPAFSRQALSSDMT
jgi:3-oxoacyl-[acyl-carrier-protein] synthase-1